MKKMILISFLILLMAGMGYSQDKLGVPIWNVGDKWVFDQGTVEVVAVDENN